MAEDTEPRCPLAPILPKLWGFAGSAAIPPAEGPVLAPGSVLAPAQPYMTDEATASIHRRLERIENPPVGWSVPPATAEELERVAAGHRVIDKIWEITQAGVAGLVVLANMIVAVAQGLGVRQGDFPVVLSSAFFLIVGFYFARTNGKKSGGAYDTRRGA